MSSFFGGSSQTPNAVAQPWGGFTAPTVSVGALSLANKIQASGFFLPNPVSFSNIVIGVVAADAVNSYDWGIYDTGGSLKAHVGARTVPATGLVDTAVSGGTIFLSAGKYYFAFTGNATTAVLGRVAGAATMPIFSFLLLVELSTASSGGALPSTAAFPADTWASGLTVHGFTLH